ncbi:hypothetical protein [Maribacter sp.]|uniref:hypothetical protein n=1 Tax=Maribacter sp. TaxID=1897614 RepID=UPI0025BD57EC|nr:hypothetical protein [Maribacter sp.]
MMDNFEKKIRDNKEFFDDKKADRKKMWDAISMELETEPTKVIPFWKFPIFKVAASILLIVGLFTITGPLVLNNAGIETSYANKEILDIESHYEGLVAYQVKLVQNHPVLTKDDKVEFLSFMQELDDEYYLLKLEMRKNLDNELILEALIGNYKKRIELIENLLKQINSSKKINDDYGYTL